MRITSKVVASLGSLALASAAMVGFASSASAAASPSSTHLQCQGASWSFANQAGPAFTGSAGDQLTISNPNTSGATSVTWTLPAGFTLVSGSLTIAQGGPSAVISYGSSNGTLSVTSTSACNGSSSASINVTISAGGGGSSSSSSVATGPAPVFQQFGKPATGTCADAAVATLNWAGVASGGWGESWAQWMNGGKGGAVCNRALIYSLGLSKWVVNA